MRYLILSDIHANLTAFEAVLRDAAPFDQIWCIGDIVGYGPNPNECIELLREYDHICVAGNHDWASLGRLDPEDFNPDARQAALWTQRQLTPANMDYLARLPVRIERDGLTLVHGSPRQPIWEYILYSGMAAANFPLFETPYCFVGHTHTPIIYQEVRAGDIISAIPLEAPYDEPFPLGEDRLIINPGSVGQPRDGDPRASYVLLDLERKEILYRRVPYEVSRTQAQMRELGLPARLIARLAFGW